MRGLRIFDTEHFEYGEHIKKVEIQEDKKRINPFYNSCLVSNRDMFVRSSRRFIASSGGHIELSNDAAFLLEADDKCMQRADDKMSERKKTERTKSYLKRV